MLVALALVGLAAPDTSARRRKPVKVLGLKVEGYDLSQKDKDDLFQVVQQKLKRYPHITLVHPPDGELTDEMIELECIDVDTDCLVKLGRKYNATRVFYVQVDPEEGSFKLTIRVVNANRKRSLRDREATVSSLTKLAGALEREIEQVFGAEPSAEPAEGTILVAANVPGAKIYVNGEYAGTGKIKLKKPPGTYAIRINKVGYEEALFNLQVAARKLVRKMVEMVPLPDKPPVDPDLPPDDGTDKDRPLYKSPVLWGVVGGVVVAGVVAALLLGGDEEATGPRGSTVLSVDGNAAWRDAAIRRSVR